MTKSYRPCLTCRQLFIPSKGNTSHCDIHKPKQVYKKNYKRGIKRGYDDPEYRRNRALIRKAQQNCVMCGTQGNSSNPLECDHIIPVSKGGSHDLANLRILCRQCHKKRRGIAHK